MRGWRRFWFNREERVLQIDWYPTPINLFAGNLLRRSWPYAKNLRRVWAGQIDPRHGVSNAKPIFATPKPVSRSRLGVAATARFGLYAPVLYHRFEASIFGDGP